MSNRLGSRKKIYVALWVAAAFLLAVAAVLFLTTKLSDAHKIAVSKLENSKELGDLVGGIRHLILVGANSELRPNSVSCAERRYLVVGNEDVMFVSVYLRKIDFHHGIWEVLEIAKGWITAPFDTCKSGA